MLYTLFFQLFDHEEAGVKEASYAVSETILFTPGKAGRGRARDTSLGKK